MVHRTLEFLEAFADQKRPLSLTELMKLLGIPASSCHDVVQALQARGYLYEVQPRGGYYPTHRLLELSRQIAENDPFLLRAEPLLARLRAEAGESVFLCKASQDSLQYLLVLEGEARMRLSVKAGDVIRSLHATSAGKALLGSLSPARCAEVIDGLALKALTPKTITAKSALLSDLHASQARGWYLNREESVEDMLTASAPFSANNVLHVVTVAGSVTRMVRKLDTVVARLLAAAHELGASAAYRA